MSKRTAIISIASMIGAFLIATGAEVLIGAAPAVAGCAPDPQTYWKKTTVSYTTIGPAAGEHNSGAQRVDFSYSRKTDVTASTSVSAGAGFTVDAGIASVSAELHITLTKTVTKGTVVTGHLWIPAHEGGTMQPKAQFTKFTRYRTQTTPQCGSQTTVLGTMHGITKATYFATCTGSDSCTPKP